MNSHDFDGIKVIHRSPRFGEGKIVELTDRYITIQFDNEAEAGITHRFIFPDSFFNNQLLVTRNKRLRNYLAEHSEGFRCARCGTYTVSPVIPGIGVLCDSCQSKVAVCDRCNHSFYKKDCVALAQKPGHYLCRTCFDIKFPKCFICHKTIAPGSNEATPEIENGRPICSDCLEKYYIECPKCGVILKKDDCFTLSDPAGYADYLCPECAEKYVCHCAICGSEFILRSEKSPHICHDCLIKMDYEAFMDHFDLDKCSKESYYFSRAISCTVSF